MKVEVIRGGISQMQSALQAFLNANPDIDIVAMSQATCPTWQGSQYGMWDVETTIIYKEPLDTSEDSGDI